MLGQVYCLERVSMDEQLKELLRQRQFDEALALAEESAAEIGLENVKEKLSMVHAQAGFLLFFDLSFKDAIDHFLQSSTMHPAEIFPFFPDMTERWRSVVKLFSIFENSIDDLHLINLSSNVACIL